MGLSCLNCFGGGKEVRRVESPEPAPRPRPVEEEKVMPHPISHSPEPLEKEPVQARQAPKLTVPSLKASSIKDVTSSPLSEFKLDLPPSPAVEKTSIQFPEPRTSSTTSRKSGESPHRTRPPIPATHPVRTVSASSSTTSHGSSLRPTSTKATTPPLTPADATHKTAPLPIVARVGTPTQPPAQIQADSPTLSRDDPAKVTSAPGIAPLEIQKIDRQPSPTLPTSPVAQSPTSSPPAPSHPSPPLASSSTALPVRKSSASPISPPQPSPRKPTLDISTTLPPRRPSCEFDTPTTAAATPIPQSAPGALNRVSTAPLPANQALKEKRKSRLSRFLSIRETGKVAGGLGKRGKSVRHSQAFPFVGQNHGGAGGKDVGTGAGGSAGGMGILKETQGEGGGMDAQRSSAEKAEWERELEAKRVEGRKWKEEEDNESLFCY